MTPEVDKEMTRRRNAIGGSRVGYVSSWSVEIIGKYNGKHHALLNEKRCNCRQYEKVQIPCGHAMLTADSIGLSYQNLVGSLYKTSTWAATYKGIINPELESNDIDIPDDIMSH
ncbi:hypothetical protein V5N11_020120 [Cardamine amara subsp. amara]|uniref:Zinc finger PMZ-type domain-containing protein n=1 Tax=Cardamine amara subsp. amara TaxID=228776 RepID=A0ABD1AKM6_CARAN